MPLIVKVIRSKTTKKSNKLCMEQYDILFVARKLYNKGLEPMAHKPEVALSMTACGSLVNRKILLDIPSKLMASQGMLLTFATNHALLQIMLY